MFKRNKKSTINFYINRKNLIPSNLYINFIHIYKNYKKGKLIKNNYMKKLIYNKNNLKLTSLFN